MTVRFYPSAEKPRSLLVLLFVSVYVSLSKNSIFIATPYFESESGCKDKDFFLTMQIFRKLFCYFLIKFLFFVPKACFITRKSLLDYLYRTYRRNDLYMGCNLLANRILPAHCSQD